MKKFSDILKPLAFSACCILLPLQKAAAQQPISAGEKETTGVLDILKQKGITFSDEAKRLCLSVRVSDTDHTILIQMAGTLGLPIPDSISNKNVTHTTDIALESQYKNGEYSIDYIKVESSLPGQGADFYNTMFYPKPIDKSNEAGKNFKEIVSFFSKKNAGKNNKSSSTEITDPMISLPAYIQKAGINATIYSPKF